MNQTEAENFVKAWQTSNSGTEVANRLGLTERQVSSRGYRLRKKGVLLRRFTGGNSGRALDIDALKKLAESLAQVQP